jgi:hypothetical protein
MRHTIVFFLFLMVPAFAQAGGGSIRGMVLTYDGLPVGHAHVSAEVMDGSKIITGLEGTTDEFGAFAITGLAMGEYRLSAQKEEDSYLSTRPDIFNDTPPMTFLITQDALALSTIIRFRSRAATITGWVRDSSTGMPIAAHLSLAPKNGRGWSTGGVNPQFKFSRQIPANSLVFLGACAEGYEPWFYADASDPPHRVALELESGAQLEVNIYLIRNWKDRKTECFGSRY